jgi:hypothetical protein
MNILLTFALVAQSWPKCCAHLHPTSGYKFYLANGHQTSEMMRDWTRAQRKARAHPKPLEPQGKHAKAIARLEKQLYKIGTPRPPHCALLYERRYSDAEGSYWRESGVQWAKWKREARLRNKLWHVANKRVGWTNKHRTAAIYEDARALGVTVKRWSDITGKEQERIGGLFDYRKNGTSSLPIVIMQTLGQITMQTGWIRYEHARSWKARLRESGR